MRSKAQGEGREAADERLSQFIGNRALRQRVFTFGATIAWCRCRTRAVASVRAAHGGHAQSHNPGGGAMEKIRLDVDGIVVDSFVVPGEPGELEAGTTRNCATPTCTCTCP